MRATEHKPPSRLERLGLSIPLVLISALSTYGNASAALLTLLPIVLCCQRIWQRAFLLALIFYLTLNVEEIVVYRNFFHSTLQRGAGVWLLHSALLALIVSLLYCGRSTLTKTVLGFWAATLVLILPPLGLFVWMQPIIAAGALFPGLGWLGLLLWMMLASTSIAVLSGKIQGKRVRVCCVILTGVMLIATIANFRDIYPAKISKPGYLNTFQAIDTYFGESPKSLFEQMTRQQSMQQSVLKAFDNGKHVVIFPENASDEMAGTQQFWQDTLKRAKFDDATVIIGSLKNENGNITKGLHVYTKQDSMFYPAMFPMPLGEWTPFGNYQTNIWQPEVFTLKVGKKILRVAYLICYEQMVPWPLHYVFSANPKPDLIIAVANQWFATKTSYHKQLLSIRLLARLFYLPFFVATNR